MANEGTHIPGEAEERAKQLGWVPPDEFKGDPAKAVDAATFLKRQDNNLSAMRGKLDRQGQKIEELTETITRQQQDFADQVEQLQHMSDEALAQQRRQLQSKYEGIKRQAVAEGDTDAFDQAQADQKKALDAFDEKTAEAKKTKKQPEGDGGSDGKKGGLSKPDQETIEGWIDENPWFTRDAKVANWAEARHAELLRDEPGLSLRDNLNKVAEEVQATFYGKKKEEGNGADDEPGDISPYAGGRRMSHGSGGTGKGYSDLPDSAKKQCQKFIEKDGLFLQKGETIEKDLAKAQQRYADSWFKQRKPVQVQ